QYAGSTEVVRLNGWDIITSGNVDSYEAGSPLRALGVLPKHRPHERGFVPRIYGPSQGRDYFWLFTGEHEDEPNLTRRQGGLQPSLCGLESRALARRRRCLPP